MGVIEECGMLVDELREDPAFEVFNMVAFHDGHEH